MQRTGNPYGAHRVVEPRGVLPQSAYKIDNNMDVLYDNEIRVDVDWLNIDSASFSQIKKQAAGNTQKIERIIMDTVAARGKQHNPVTGSGGMFLGRVEKIGAALQNTIDLQPGDLIASLVSLSLTPLKIDRILAVRQETDQVRIRGQAILFESGIYAKLPSDIPPNLALAVLDVCAAPVQTTRLVNPGDTVAILGGSGKAGILCAWAAKQRAGDSGRIIGIAGSAAGLEKLEEVGICDDHLVLDAVDALQCYERIKKLTAGQMADVVINCVNVADTEMGSILMTRNRGTVYFFSMATSFTRAALGAEGVGKDIDMIIGNGYARDHAKAALDILRRSPKIRSLYERLYGC
jgi:L-erythro-3,5-diaminohexanoate dehydrogenase